MGDDGVIQIRSYRVCFELERRIHKLDRWRIPLPYGVPISGLAYCAVVLVAVLLLARLPITGPLLGTLHPAIQYVLLPVGAAVALHRWNLDGRPAHHVARAWLRLQLEPKRVCAFRAVAAPGPVALDEVTVAHDERSARLRRARVEGPASVVFRYPVELDERGRALRVRQTGDAALWRGTQVNLRAGQRVVTG